MENTNYVNRVVACIDDILDSDNKIFIKKGMMGVCTADLPSDNVFTVWFDKKIRNQHNWVTFEHKYKKHFKTIG